MIRAFQWDLARQVERMDWMLEQLPKYAEWGYQELYLHLEDAVTYPSFPGIARKDAYTTLELSRLVEAASEVGIKVVPIVNLLGHTQYLIKDPTLRDLNELRNADGSPQERGQVCPLHPKILEVADRLIADMSPFATAGKIHVGLDESFLLGRHPLSQAEIAEVGLAVHFARYVTALHALVTRRGFSFGIWGDMLALFPAAIPLLPNGTAVYDWYYYPFSRLPKMELHNFREYDLAKGVAKAGGDYWGCAMNGAFRHEVMPLFSDRLNNLRSWYHRGKTTKAAGFLSCSWEPNRLAMDLTVAIDAAAASLWLERDVDDVPTMLAHGFRRAFHLTVARSRELARLALACDLHPFSGYSRWETNQRWDTTSGHEGVARFEKEARFYERASALPHLPESLERSLEFRHYIAERDALIRSSAAEILRLRRVVTRHGAGNAILARDLTRLRDKVAGFASVLDHGRKAAKRMWKLSRDPAAQGPNESLLEGDAGRFKSLLTWIDEARTSPTLLETASPVVGRWQLQFGVILVEPALQKIVVEQEISPGAWQTVHERFTIEFRSGAARRQTKLRLEWSVPVDSAEKPLRIAIRGVGRVAIASVELIDGVTRLTPKGAAKQRKTLGKAAPAGGMPTFDWTRNEGVMALRF